MERSPLVRDNSDRWPLYSLSAFFKTVVDSSVTKFKISVNRHLILTPVNHNHVEKLLKCRIIADKETEMDMPMLLEKYV